MKTLRSIDALLKEFEQKYGIDVRAAEQGSETWMKVKLGVISASNASKAVAKRDSGTRLTYMAELVAQVCTGIFEEINAKQLDWGKQHEDAARSCYEFATGRKMRQVPFVFKDGTFREGCSPDGLVSRTRGGEIKAPFSTENYVKFVAADRLNPDYVWQVQYQMRVLEAGEWDLSQYDPRMKKHPLHTVTIERDEEKQKVFDDMIPVFIEDMDAMLKKLGFTFGEQWGQARPVEKVTVPADVVMVLGRPLMPPPISPSLVH